MRLYGDGGREYMLWSDSESDWKSDIIEEVAVVSTSEVEGLGDSGTVLLYVY